RRFGRSEPRLHQEPEWGCEPGSLVHEEGRVLERQVLGLELLGHRGGRQRAAALGHRHRLEERARRARLQGRPASGVTRRHVHAVTVSNPSQRDAAWGKIDDQIMAQAPAIPWSWTNEVYGSSTNVATVINLFNAEPDISFSSIK